MVLKARRGVCPWHRERIWCLPRSHPPSAEPPSGVGSLRQRTERRHLQSEDWQRHHIPNEPERREDHTKQSGGKAVTKNGKGVYHSPNGTNCVKTANSKGCN